MKLKFPVLLKFYFKLPSWINIVYEINKVFNSLLQNSIKGKCIFYCITSSILFCTILSKVKIPSIMRNISQNVDILQNYIERLSRRYTKTYCNTHLRKHNI